MQQKFTHVWLDLDEKLKVNFDMGKYLFKPKR